MKVLAPFVLYAVAALAAPQAAPASACKVIASDAGWPAEAVWKKAMPAITKDMAQTGKKHPDYRLDAKTVADVQAAVKFAKDNNIRLSVLNSGHDFLGRNDAPSGLHLVVSGLKGVRMSAAYVATAEGVPSVNSSTVTNVIDTKGAEGYVTFGAGYGTQELNDQTDKSHLFTIGAAQPDVATAGGWAQTAGHTALGPHYGLGADQALEYKVVTADGQLRIANAFANPDLFWALRGGGGGTFGVVVEATIIAHPVTPIAGMQFFVNTTDINDKKSIYAPAAWFHTQMADLVDERGHSGYYFIHPNAIRVGFMSVGENATEAFTNATWKPIIEKLVSFPGMSRKYVGYGQRIYPSYKNWLDLNFGAIDGGVTASSPATNATTGTAGNNGVEGEDIGGKGRPKPAPPVDSVTAFFREALQPVRNVRRHGPEDEEMEGMTVAMGINTLDSRLLGKKHFNDPSLAQILEEAMPVDLVDGQLRGNLVSGRKAWELGNDTSVHPAWRSTYSHLIQTGQGSPDAAPFRKLAPETGAYANEASPKQPNWKETYWGPNYEKLSEIKKKYDPTTVFWVTPGINADLWEVKNGRLCPSAGVQTEGNPIPPNNDNTNMVGFGVDPNGDGPIFPFWVAQDGGVFKNNASQLTNDPNFEWKKK